MCDWQSFFKEDHTKQAPIEKPAMSWGRHEGIVRHLPLRDSNYRWAKRVVGN